MQINKTLFFFITSFSIIPFSSNVECSVILLHQKDGSQDSMFFGGSVSGAGDVDGDGKADFIVGTSADPSGHSAGSVFVYSGRTGDLLFQIDGDSAGDQFGSSVAGIGDVNNDGKSDFIVGAPGADPGGFGFGGSAFVYSGATRALLYRFDGLTNASFLGFSVNGIGDANGDSVPDFIVGAHGAISLDPIRGGSVFVYSGATDSLLYRKDGVNQGDAFGFTVAGAGDVDDDGKADFVIGAPFADPNGLTNAGTAYVYSGATGDTLYQKNGDSANAYFGLSVAGVGNVDGDGNSDFIIGANDASPGGLTYAGSAYVYSGATGDTLYQKNGSSTNARFGASVAGAGDVNGDGRADFIIGAPYFLSGGRGSVFVYSGLDGSLLFQTNGQSAGDFMGNSVAGAGDVNGDRRSDFVIGAYSADPNGSIDAGSVFVYGICASKGDMNADGSLTPSDVVLMLNCVFLVNGNCALCFADVSCNGILTASDVVIELNAIFLGEPVFCSP